MEFFMKMFSGDLGIFHIVLYQITQQNHVHNRSRAFPIKREYLSPTVYAPL
jgi:hypothetical protein